MLLHVRRWIIGVYIMLEGLPMNLSDQITIKWDGGWMIEVWFIMWWDIYLTHTIFHHQCIKIRGGLRWILLIMEMLSMYIHSTHQTRGSTATEREVYAAIRADGLNFGGAWNNSPMVHLTPLITCGICGYIHSITLNRR
jgi:hypothetical protein